jgi:hypothetical protein
MEEGKGIGLAWKGPVFAFLFFRGNAQYVKSSIEFGKCSIEARKSSIETQKSSIGTEKSSIGTEKSSIGPEKSSIDATRMQPSHRNKQDFRTSLWNRSVNSLERSITDEF